jgi:hypothetical protein
LSAMGSVLESMLESMLGVTSELLWERMVKQTERMPLSAVVSVIVSMPGSAHEHIPGLLMPILRVS